MYLCLRFAFLITSQKVLLKVGEVIKKRGSFEPLLF